MAGAGIEYKIDDKALQRLLAEITGRMRNPEPAMKLIGGIVRSSVARNFEKEGRPTKWARHSKTTEKRRGKGAKILRNRGFGGGLAGSVHYNAARNSVVISSNKEYAAVHQFGAKKGSFGTFVVKVDAHKRKMKNGTIVGVRAHERNAKLPWGNIPARPFLMIQDQDWAEIKAALNDFVILGQTA